jgi:predicted P-loop ATPase/GTPase
LRNDEWDTHKLRVKNMLNWIEDRRIDTIVFKSCPGYKAYYHKLYDHYFRCKEVTKMLKVSSSVLRLIVTTKLTSST